MKRLVAVASVLITLLVPASAQAWTSNHFYSPSGNIECLYYTTRPADISCTTFNDGFVASIANYGGAAKSWDDGSWGFSPYATHYVLQYGQTYTTPSGLRCHSLTAGMKCWSPSTGHGFILSRHTWSRW